MEELERALAESRRETTRATQASQNAEAAAASERRQRAIAERLLADKEKELAAATERTRVINSGGLKGAASGSSTPP
jgi:hypothetical protein